MFRPITINAVLNGWIVSVGCQTVVYQSREMLLADLGSYLQFPIETERRFLEQAVNRAHTMGGAVPANPTIRGAQLYTYAESAPPPNYPPAATARDREVRAEQAGGGGAAQWRDLPNDGRSTDREPPPATPASAGTTWNR